MVSLESKIGYSFSNSELLREAMTHPSVSYESKNRSSDNQRLEFLGDAVLELVITDHLYRSFPNSDEGVLTQLRSRVVSKPALESLAKKIDLGAHLYLGKGEDRNGGRERASTLADGLEALFGAVFLDGGFTSAQALILSLASDLVIEMSNESSAQNPKGKLQEILQAIAPESPLYVLDHESGPDHDKVFKVTVRWQDLELGVGEGASKKAAEASAALSAIHKELWR